MTQISPRDPSDATMQRLIDAYVRHTVHRHDEDFWALDRVTDLIVGESSESAFELVRALVRAVPTEHLGYVGAGPVEDLVKRHGAELADWIVGEATRDPRFCEALSRVWLVSDALPAGLLERLQTVTGGRILTHTSADLAAVEFELEQRQPARRRHARDV